MSDPTALVGPAVALLPLLGLAFVVAVRAPFLAVAAFAAVVPFGSALTLPGPPLVDDVSSVVGVVAILALLVGLVTSTRAALPARPPLALWTLLLAAAALTTLWSVDRVATLTGVVVLASLLALYGLVAATPVTTRDVRRVETGLVLGGALVGAYAVHLAASGQLAEAVDQRFVAAWGGSETGSVADPNITAAALLLPFLLAVAAAARRGRPAVRLAAVVAAALMFIGIFLTGSRGGLLALLAGLAVLVACSPQRKRALPLLLVPVAGVLVAVAVAPASVTERVSSDSRSSGRSDIWRIAVASCPEHCLKGSGWSTFPDVHEERWLTDPRADGVQRRFEAHSVWLGTLVEGGVVALVVVVAALALTVAGVLRLPRSRRGPPLAGLVALLVSNTFLATLPFKYFWFVLIYAAMVQNLPADAEDSGVAAPRREAVAA